VPSRSPVANDRKGSSPPAEYDLDRDNDGIACEKLQLPLPRL
jgi:hypothetical protein